ncbi:ATP-binding protein [Candidatus Stoquefichus massiliensis]|uniref:ATP-binding protein n=1 Tax=Candidatus Stoquefichus massiliensis TaxID=1470350 RepID=UPI0004B68E41|nr:ATP-binding protein [Candidatus Stoquefichus massiliensis]
MGIMTGCLKISNESIFTGFNNYIVYSIFDYESSECFGFTEDEVKTMLDDYELSEFYDEVKEWYDGYLFGNTEIYNPWSTLKYVHRKLQNRSSDAESFWANISSNEIIYDYISRLDRTLRDEIGILMQCQTIDKHINLELTYREMDDIDNIYSFLLLTGYMKISENKGHHIYSLIIPNKEVYEIYEQSFMKYFILYAKSRKKELYQKLVEGKSEEANIILNDILNHSISYYDNQENFYYGFLVGLFSDYTVESNREFGDGRFDICILPPTMLETVIVIECKHSSSVTELLEDATRAAEQIKEKKYIDGIKNKGYLHVVGYGISFYKKQCYIMKASCME